MLKFQVPSEVAAQPSAASWSHLYHHPVVISEPLQLRLRVQAANSTSVHVTSEEGHSHVLVQGQSLHACDSRTAVKPAHQIQSMVSWAQQDIQSCNRETRGSAWQMHGSPCEASTS